MTAGQIRTGEVRMIKWGIIPSQPGYQITVGQMIAGALNYKVVAIIPEPLESGRVKFHIQVKKALLTKENPQIDKNTKWSEPFLHGSYSGKAEPDFVQYDGEKEYINV